MHDRRPLAPQWDLVRESFAEAEFLWGRWEAALDSPRHTVDDVERWIEARLLGAIDGVCLGGARALQELVVPALRHRRPRTIATAAFLASSMGAAGLDGIVDALRSADDRRRLGLRRGLERSTTAGIDAALVDRLPRLPARAQATVLEALAFRATAAPGGLDRLVDVESPDVQRAALRLAGSTRDAWTERYIAWGLAQPDARGVEAARAGLVRGVRGAVGVARDAIAAGLDGASALLPWLGLAIGEHALDLVDARLQSAPRDRDAIEALAGIGTVAAADRLADVLATAPDDELASEALGTVTGIDVRPAADEPARLEAATMAERRWRAERDRYPGGVRHLFGRPFDARRVPGLLGCAATRRRHVLACDLAHRTLGAVQVQTTTWTPIQRAQLARAA